MPRSKKELHSEREFLLNRASRDAQSLFGDSFYTLLPAVPPIHNSPRTFIVLPKRSSRSVSHFLEARNGIAPDELQAHTGIFSAQTNDGYYELGLQTSRIIRESVMLGKGIYDETVDDPPNPEEPSSDEGAV